MFLKQRLHWPNPTLPYPTCSTVWHLQPYHTAYWYWHTPQRFTPSSRACCGPFLWFDKFCALLTVCQRCCPMYMLGLETQTAHCTGTLKRYTAPTWTQTL